MSSLSRSRSRHRRISLSLLGAHASQDNNVETQTTPPPQYRDLSPAPPFYSTLLHSDEDPIIHFDLVRFSRDQNYTGHFGEWLCSVHLVWAMCARLADSETDLEWTAVFEQSRPQWDKIQEDLLKISEQRRVDPNARFRLEIPPAPVGRMIIRQTNAPFQSWHIMGRRFQFTEEEGSSVYNMEHNFVLFRQFLMSIYWPNNERFHITLMDTTWLGITIE